MKLISLNNKIVSTIIVCIIAFIIAGLSLWVQHSANQALENSALSEMEQIGARLELLLEHNINDGYQTLALLSKYISRNNIKEEDTIKFLNSHIGINEFQTLFYIDTDGNGVSIDDIKQDFSVNSFFASALNSETSISSPYLFDDQVQIAVSIFVPVINDGLVTGVLWGEVLLDDFISVFNSLTNNSGDIYFIDENTNILFSTSDDYSSDIITEEKGIIQQSILESNNVDNINNGSFVYEYSNAEKVFAYYHIENTGWTLAITVESNEINGEMADAVNRLNIICIIIYWSLIGLICYTSYYHISSMKKIEKTNYFDHLTGLPTLIKFRMLVADMIKKHPNMKFTMQKMDIIKFHVINEVYGFDNGNLVLIKIAETLNDIQEETFIAARVGVDEFLMFSGNGLLEKDNFNCDIFEKQFLDNISELKNHEFKFRYGRYFIDNYETDVIDIINKTSLAHGMAKKNPAKKSWDYDDTFRMELYRKNEISNKKKAALANNEFKVFLQPKFNIQNETLIGAEALVRWIEPNGNMIFPNDFIPNFEKDGFIIELDRHILEQSCILLRKWLDDGLDGIPISVNLSRVNLVNFDISESIVNTVDKYNIPHNLIEIELTESALAENQNALNVFFKQLREHGFKTSIDDFGSGYSSLSMLKDLNVTTLKLDKNFFDEGMSARRDDMLIDGIIKLSQGLGMFVIAEGIETPEQVMMLRSMNCDAVQGYVFDRPMSTDDFLQKYKSSMQKKLGSLQENIELIQSINDTKYASSFVPCGILVAKLDESLTIVEANEGFFNIIGYTHGEVKSLYKNRGIDMVHPADREELVSYTNSSIAKDSEALLEYVCHIETKKQGYKVVQLSGKTTKNERGKQRLYFSLTDLTSYANATNDLQKEKEFNSTIASLTNNAFFDYNCSSNSIRFSRNFAEKFEVSDTIINFNETDLCKKAFPHLAEINNGDITNLPNRIEGEFCINLPSGEPIWYIYSSKKIFDQEENRNRIVGKMSEAIAHSLEMNILKAKSEADSLTRIYNKSATDRYIHNYLRITTHDIETCALLIIEIENFEKIKVLYGQEYSDDCVGEIGQLLRNMFRSSDIIGRTAEKEFYVFIGDYKSLDIVQKKADEVRDSLNINYKKDGKDLHIKAHIGIALYPEDGDNYDSLYNYAVCALNNSKKSM